MIKRYKIETNTQQVLQLNGASSYGVIPVTPSPDGFCIGIWAKDAYVSGNKTILDCTSTDNTDGFKLAINGVNGEIALQVFNGVTLTGSLGVKRRSDVDTFYVIAYKPNELKLYKMGKLYGTDTSVQMSTPGQLQLGKGLAYGSSCYPGSVHDIFFQNTTELWTKEEIEDMMFYKTLPVRDGEEAKHWSLNQTNTDQNGENAIILTSTTYGGTTKNKPRHILPTTAQKSIDLSATNKLITIPFNVSTTGFNIFFRFKHKAIITTSQNFLFGQLAGAGYNDGFQIFTAPTAPYNRLQMLLYDSTTNKGTLTSFPFRGGAWNSCAATFKIDEAKLYVNAVLGAIDTSCTITNPATSPLTINQKAWTGGGGALLRVKDVVFQNSDTPWTQEQIDDIEYRNIIPDGAYHWSLNNTLLDQNGGNALTATGASFVDDAPFQPRSTI